jgi:hypothetical protein
MACLGELRLRTSRRRRLLGRVYCIGVGIGLVSVEYWMQGAPGIVSRFEEA